MWTLYDELIEGIPRELTADQLICGMYNTLVKSGESYGIGTSLDQTFRSELLPKKLPGMPLRDLAACIKSWNYPEAGIGLAAINAYYNEPERLRALGVAIPAAMNVEDRAYDPFIAYQNEIRGKKVVVIGRFPFLDSLFAPVCELSVIEKFYPDDGDYPEQAADYLLPECDFAFISSFTFAEKTLPRYLKLATGAYITIVGPATTMSPILFDYGAHDLAGFVVKDGDVAERASLGYGGSVHAAGQKVSFKR